MSEPTSEPNAAEDPIRLTTPLAEGDVVSLRAGRRPGGAARAGAKDHNGRQERWVKQPAYS